MVRIINQFESDSAATSGEETKRMEDSEEVFYQAFGFSLPPKGRRSVLSSKAELSLTIQEVSQLQKASLLQIPAFDEPYFRLRKRDFGVAIIETLLIPGIFLLMAFVIHGKAAAAENLSLSLLATTGVLYLCGFSLFYYLFQQKIRPFFTLRRTGLKFGERFPAKL